MQKSLRKNVFLVILFSLIMACCAGLVACGVNGDDEEGGDDELPPTVTVDAATDTVPSGTGFEIKSAAAAGDTAVSKWNVVYGEQGLDICAYVEDGTLIDNKDGVEFYVGKSGFAYTSLSSVNFGVSVGVDGTVKQYSVSNGKYAVTDEGIFSASVKLWTNGGSDVVGYKVTISVPYEKLSLTADAAKGNVNVLPVLNNGDTAGSAFGATKSVFNGYEINNPATYPVLVDDNKWKENSYAEGVGQLGGVANIAMGSKWDVSKDYAEEDTENYPDRVVTLNGSDGDNNLVFFRTQGNEVYARATFKVTNIYNNENYGKFGLMLFDGTSQKGIFFYVDAFVGDEYNDGVIRGTSLGYNTATGAWGAWNGISGTDGSFNLSNKTITLAMTYSKGFVSLYCGNTLVKQLAYMPDGDVAIGIKSFNYGLEVTNYISIDDPENDEFAAHNPEIEKQELDVLFAGASYVEWWDNESVFTNMTSVYGMKTVDIGVAGSKIPDWNNQSKMDYIAKQYDPAKIVFHLALNDVNDSGDSVETVIANLKAMYTAYHAEFPQAQLYWVGYIPNNVFAVNNTKYYQINHTMSDWAEETDWFGYIDVWNVFCQDGYNGDNNAEIRPRTNLFLTGTDGMHPNASYGYPLWGATILEALGYERDHGGAFGDYDGDVNKYYYTYGWDIENDTAVNTGGNEQAIYYSAQGYTTDILFEVDLKATTVYNNDPYPKAGLMLRNDSFTIFAYFDLANASGVVDIVYRNNNANGPNDWLWGSQAPSATTGVNINNDFAKIAIAKKGNVIYMLVNGDVVTSMTVAGVAADTEFIAGVVGFNIKMEVKNPNVVTDTTQLENLLRASHSITTTKYTGVSYNLSSEKAKVGDTVTFTVTSSAEISAVKVSYGATSVEATYANGKYSFTMPDADVTLSIVFDGLYTITPDGSIADRIELSSSTAGFEETVTITAKDNYIIGKLYANGEEIVPAGNVYAVTVTKDLTITGEVYFTVDGFTIDGKLDGAYGTISTTAEYSGDRSIEVYALKTASGVVIYVKATMNSKKTDGAAWHENTNFEFQLNASGQRYVNVNGLSSGVTEFNWSDSHTGGKYVYILEIFVAKDNISGFANGDIQLNYAWKTLGESAHYEGNPVGYMSVTDTEWLAIHEYGGLNGDYYLDFGYKGTPKNLYITANGIEEIQTRTATPTHATIDGNLTEYEGKTVLTRGDATKASVQITGFAADDGLYLAFTITHGEWSTYVNNNWAANDNIELRINNVPTAIVWIDGQIVLTNMITEAASVTTVVDGKNVTTAEIFIAGAGDVYRLQIGCAGNGFGGWQELAWGTQVYFRANDIVEYDPLDQTVTNANITLDGNFTESFWTEEVKSKAFTTTANGATVTVIGVNTAAGVMIGVTVVHTKPVGEAIQQDGTAWWHLMNIEFRLGGNNWQLAASVYSGQTSVNQCRSGYKTVDNGDGTYTTTFEIIAAHYPTFNDGSSNVIVAFGGVINTGFAWLFGGNDTTYTHAITPNGMELII